MGKIRAVLFDCDGLMFNTERIAQQVWADAAEENGIRLPEDFFVRITGAGGPKELEYIRNVMQNDPLVEEIRQKRFDLEFWSSFQKGKLVKKGLEELTDWLTEHGILIGVASSSSKDYVKTLLDNTSHPIRYDALCTGDMVRYAKPDPEIFLLCAQKLDVHPEECLVLEDSRQGIVAAHRAGMHPGFIQVTIVPDEEMLSYMEYRFEDLSEVIGLLEKEGVCTAS